MAILLPWFWKNRKASTTKDIIAEWRAADESFEVYRNEAEVVLAVCLFCLMHYFSEVSSRKIVSNCCSLIALNRFFPRQTVRCHLQLFPSLPPRDSVVWILVRQASMRAAANQQTVRPPFLLNNKSFSSVLTPFITRAMFGRIRITDEKILPVSWISDIFDSLCVKA